MRRIVIVIPDWVREDSGSDPLRQNLPTLERMAEFGKPFKVGQLPAVECPEAFDLGMPPGVAELRQGPLTISALGADPPERSTQFHLSLAEYRDGTIRDSSIEPTPGDLARVLELVPKLNTKTLTFVKGQGRNHGLVWEDVGHMRTFSISEADGQPMKDRLPEGDGEPMLRRYIDDSINILSELELNQRRADEDLPLLNLLWPWGNGMRLRLPNLALKRGEPCLVISSSMRLQGLTRLVGYRHVDRTLYRSGMQFDLSRASSAALGVNSSVILVDTLSNLTGERFEEERNWFTREIEQKLLTPLMDSLRLEPTRLTIVSGSGASLGLGVEIETGQFGSGHIPFDLRALDEKLLPIQTFWESVAAGLAV